MSRQAEHERSGGLPKASFAAARAPFVGAQTLKPVRKGDRISGGQRDGAGEHVPLPRLHTQLPLTACPPRQTHRAPAHQSHPSRFAIDPIFYLFFKPQPRPTQDCRTRQTSPHRNQPQKRQPGLVPSTPQFKPPAPAWSRPPTTPTHRGPPPPPRSNPPATPTYQGTIHLPPGPQSSRCHP